MAESAFAQHIVESIRKELDLLKKHDYIQPHAYDQILNLLPKDVTSSNKRDMPSYPSSTNAPASPFAGAMPSPVHNNPLPSPAHNSPLPPPPSYNSANENSLGSAEALYDYTGENPNTDLTIHRGDIIQLTEFVNNDWWKGTLNGKTGIFPSNYVKKIDTPMNEKKNASPPPPTPSRGYGYSPKQNNSYAPPPSSYAAPVQNYAPPPVQTYTPPPAQNNNFAPPPIQGQVQSYAPPPVQHVASTSSAPAVVEEQHESRVSSFGKKFAGNVANAATWGFGATLGSDLANSIF